MGLLLGAKVDQALASSRGLVVKAHYGDHFSGTILLDQSLEQNLSTNTNRWKRRRRGRFSENRFFQNEPVLILNYIF